MRIKAAVTSEEGMDFDIREIELQGPKANEVLIKVVASGICHTDISAKDTGMTPKPAVLGHEGSGIVEKVGACVEHFEKGDHVVMSIAHCGHCTQCLSGHPAMCASLTELNFGGKAQDGTHRHYENGQELSLFFGQSSFATYAVAHERNIVKVTKDVDLTLLGPLGCGIQTGAGTVLNSLEPGSKSTIAVFGAGSVGLSAVMAAKIANCRNIIAVDLHDSRLKMAEELGATHVFNSNESENIVEKIKQLTDGGVHYAIDTTGVSQVITLALQSLCTKGQLAFVAGGSEFEVDALTEGKSAISIIQGDAVPKIFIPELISYYQMGLFPFDKLIKCYAFKDINQAVRDSERGTTIKPVLKISQ